MKLYLLIMQELLILTHLQYLQNGSEKIHGSTDDLTVSTERAGNTLVYTDRNTGLAAKE